MTMMKFRVNEEVKEAYSVYDILAEELDEEIYDEWLDETCEPGGRRSRVKPSDESLKIKTKHAERRVKANGQRKGKGEDNEETHNT